MKLFLVILGFFILSLFVGCTKRKIDRKPACHFEIVRLDLEKFEPVYADICD